MLFFFFEKSVVFGTNKGVLHYVLNRELALPRKSDDFELEIFAKERGGRAARCMGSVPVAEILTSEARHARASGHMRPRQECRRRPPQQPLPGRSFERVMRDLATPSN